MLTSVQILNQVLNIFPELLAGGFVTFYFFLFVVRLAKIT